MITVWLHVALTLGRLVHSYLSVVPSSYCEFYDTYFVRLHPTNHCFLLDSLVTRELVPSVCVELVIRSSSKLVQPVL